MKWEKKLKILKMLWNTLYENYGNTANKNSSVRKTKQNKLMLLN